MNHKNHSSDIIKRDKKIAQRKRNIIMTIQMMAIFVLTAVAQPQTNNFAAR